MGLGNILQLTQVTLFVISFIFSFFIFLPLSFYSSDFNENCLLFANGKWSYDNSSSLVLSVDWGGEGTCQFPLVVGILILPISFYCITSLGIYLYKGLDQTWLQSFVTLTICCVVSFLLMVSGIVITAGFKQWCQLLNQKVQCDVGEFVPFIINDDPSINKEGFYVQMGIAQFGVWASWLCWLSLSVCATIKMYQFHRQEDFFQSMHRERERLVQRIGRTPQDI
ncbi:hypothetical protein CAPTEDRAFT_173925 [Capitella teleta]|uniref:Transmembrane protein 179 n=1 Tax=Capitella teleta TaxID=283909 RepID=R7V208_CAPTE|nr:hypothetical protein CAPTEDRAFT_173925 [Capitella teleta]|eukprot:ELU12883.1 hypothetical protein CAPTEDRAFT_173925 [Capitella teleta]